MLNRAMEPAAATTVRYTRGAAVISDALTATFTAEQVEIVTASDTTVIGRQFTWRLKQSELLVDNAKTKPQRNDVIEWYFGGTTYTFTVLPELSGVESQTADIRSDWVSASVKLTGVV